MIVLDVCMYVCMYVCNDNRFVCKYVCINACMYMIDCKEFF